VLPQDDACSSLRRNSAATATGIQIASAMLGNKPRGVSIEGRVNVDTSGEVRRMIAEVLHSIPPAITVDFSGVTYLDTSGLATLLEASRIARQQGTRLVVAGLHDQPRELLHFTQIDRLIEIAEPEPRQPKDQPR
jgi:anti-sigma B factor antagonist